MTTYSKETLWVSLNSDKGKWERVSICLCVCVCTHLCTFGHALCICPNWEVNSPGNNRKLISKDMNWGTAACYVSGSGHLEARWRATTPVCAGLLCLRCPSASWGYWLKALRHYSENCMGRSIQSLFLCKLSLLFLFPDGWAGVTN